MRRTVRLVVACVTAATVSVLGASVSAGSTPMATRAAPSSYPPPVPASDPPRTAVDPLNLDRGPDPRVVHYDQRRHVIHDGARTVPARFPGRVVKLAKVYGGYVLDSETGTGSVLRKVSRSGRVRVLARVAGFGIFGRVSADRRTMVYHPSVRTWRAVVVRLSDGKVLASRVFGNQPTVVSVTSRRALLSNTVHTYWWTYRSGRMTRLAEDPVTQAALDVDRLVLDWRGVGRDYLTSLARRADPSWSWRRNQPAGRFSPNGRRILTLTPRPGARYDGEYVAIRVRGTRHGRIARVLTGRFGVESYPQDPRWETSSTFLVLALAPPTADNVERMAWVRCTVGGACENASPVFRVGTGPSPWVLADQPTH